MSAEIGKDLFKSKRGQIIAIVTLAAVVTLVSLSMGKGSGILGDIKAIAASNYQVIDNETANGLIKNSMPLVLDVRPTDLFVKAHIPGAINIPLEELEKRAYEIQNRKDQSVLLYCRTSNRSRRAAEFLSGRGFAKLFVLSGGFEAWALAKHGEDKPGS